MVIDLGVVKLSTCDVTSSQVVHRRTLAFLMTHIGTFKIDIATVYNQPGISTTRSTLIKILKYILTSDLCVSPDHRFYQKWAPLTDPADTRSGIKGYVKASLSVLMKGDALSMPSLPLSSSSGASEDIEKSVMLCREYHNVFKTTRHHDYDKVLQKLHW